MNSIKNLHRLKRLHQLIRSECTGTPYELSRRLHVSERLVYLLVEQLRDFDALIDYDRSRQTYYYRELFDCGTACLSSLFLYHGLFFSLPNGISVGQDIVFMSSLNWPISKEYKRWYIDLHLLIPIVFLVWFSLILWVLEIMS